MVKDLKFLVVFLFISLAIVVTGYTEDNRIKNVILFIGDGMQLECEIAASRYLYGSDYSLIWHQFETQLYVTTWDITTYNRYAWSLNKPPYDPNNFDESLGYDIVRGGDHPYPLNKTNSDDYILLKLEAFGSYDETTVKIPATDSAAAATAMATGYKTDRGNISWKAGDPESGKLTTIAEQLRHQKGSAIGIVSTVPFSDSTPAAFVSHNKSRYNYYSNNCRSGIADEIIKEFKPEVVISGGHPVLNNPEFKDNEGFISEGLMQYLKKSSEYIFVEREAGAIASQALHDGAEKALKSNKKFFGLFGNEKGNFEVKMPVNSNGAPQFNQISMEDPSLGDATSAALDVLSKNENGFFAMIEQGDIDKSNHKNNFQRMIGNVLDLDNAVRSAIEFVDRPGDSMDWGNTILIVTADHANGYLRLHKPLGKGVLPRQIEQDKKNIYPDHEITYSATDHTNELVTFYARGNLAETVQKYKKRNNKIIDNTDIYKIIRDCTGVK